MRWGILKTRDGDARFYYAVIFAVAALVLARQFIFPGYYHSPDDDAAIMPKYVPQFMESFRQGVLFPRWMPEDFGGYGSPAFVFYSPLLYLLSSVLNMAGFGLPLSKSILELVRLSVGAVFVFLFLDEKYTRKASLTAAFFYILLPSRILDLYYVSSPAARFGQAFIPAILYFTRKYVHGPFSRRNLAGVGISYSALVLSHIATAYIFTPFLLAYVIVVAEGKRTKAALTLLLGIGTGVCLSAFFFLPVLLERGYIQIQFMNRFSYWNNFLFAPLHPTGAADAEYLRHMITDAILVESSMAALFYYLSRRYAGMRLDRETGLFLAASLVCLFMMSSYSLFLWKRIPGLWTVSFSSRFETVNLLFLPAFLGVTFTTLLRCKGLNKPLTTAAFALLLCILAYDARLIAVSNSYSEGDAARLARTAEFPEYLPETVKLDGLAGLSREDPLLSSNDDFSARIIRWGCIDRAFVVDSPRGARLRVKTFYFPGWRGWIDGRESALKAQEKTGAILIDVPPGRHEVVIKFTNTWPRTLGAVISIITLVVLVAPFTRPQGRAPGA